MYSGEPTANTALAEVLQGMRRDWSVGGQKEGKILKRGKPDIYITEPGSMPVVIETEWMPARTLESDVESRLGVENVDGQKIESVIGMRLPHRLKHYENEGLRIQLRAAKDLEYAVYTPERFPKDGWLTGDLASVAAIAQIIAVSRSKVNDSVSVMLGSIDTISKLIDQCGSDTKREIGEILHQKQTQQTWKMAGLILSNALVFHTHIAGQRDIKTLLDLSVLGQIPPLSLLGEWDKILGINYYAIFNVARNILANIDDVTAQGVVERLVKMANKINRTGLTHSTEMYGELIQKMIEDRKTLASFYTRSESASLLAGLVAPPPDSPLYESEESMGSVMVVDPACGTGTLLTALYRNLMQNYEISGGDMKTMHAKIVGNGIYGFDVLPSAVHLTASALADVFPSVMFEESKVATVFLGRHEGALHLGSLDLMLKTPTFDQKGVLIAAGGEKPYYSHELHGKLFDMVIMNPPFTSNTREGGREGHAMFSSLGISGQTRKEMAKREKNLFSETCADGNAGGATNFMAVADKILRPGGTLGMVLPATVACGSAWTKAREMLKQKYENMAVVSIAGPGTTDGSFSFNTNMNEILLVAKKVGRSEHAKITGMLEDLRRERRNETNAKAAIKRAKKDAKKKGMSVKIAKRQAVAESKLAAALRDKDALEKKLGRIVDDKRGRFVSLERAPPSILYSIGVCSAVHRIGNVLKYEDGVTGATQLKVGNETVGKILDCPLDEDWAYVNVYDAALAQFAYQLSRGRFVAIGKGTTSDVQMTVLGDNVGPISRDVADNKPTDKRAPFTIHPLGSDAVYYALSENSAEMQNTLCIEPDTMAVPKQNHQNIQNIAKTASRLHVNILCRYNSQCMTVLYTSRETLGTGASLPSCYTKPEYEKAFSAWCNSTLGILCHWHNSCKQSFGRGITSNTAVRTMPILDFDKLDDEQIVAFNDLFDTHCDKPLLPIMDLDRDRTRTELDKGVMRILGVCEPLDDIRARLCREPSIRGHKTRQILPSVY